MRPSVASPLSPTRWLNNFIDLTLTLLCQQDPSYIRDDFPQQIDEHTLLVSFNVVSLYTDISHDLVLMAIEYWLDNYGTFSARKFSKQFILEAISLVLKNNTFQFDYMHKFFKQIQGTAMETKMAPTHATLVIGYLEKQLYSK